MNNLQEIGNVSDLVFKLRNKLNEFNPELFMSIRIDIPSNQREPATIEMQFSNRQGSVRGDRLKISVGIGLDLYLDNLKQRFIEAGLNES